MTPRRRVTVTALLALGFSVALIAFILFATLFVTSIKESTRISDDLYIHPFTVNSAAASLKTSIYQMRSEALLIVLMKMRDNEWTNSSARINAFERSAYQSLAVIKGNFLGDMSRVNLLEKYMLEWHGIRAEILSEVRKGNFDTADSFIKIRGTSKFNEILDQVEYVQNFSQRRAARFVAEAGERSADALYQGQALALILIVVVIATAIVVITRVRVLHQELLILATQDTLTGIRNRGTLLSLIRDEHYRAKRYGNHFSLALVDLDHFKKINDAFGHLAGDVVLKHFCSICLAGLRQSDALGRLGGEEFGILLPNTPASDAQPVIERIRLALAESVVRYGDHEIYVTGSFGLVTSYPESEFQDPDSLFKAADAAMYTAKERGRNQVVCQ